MFDHQTVAEVKRHADRLKLEAEVLLAVAEIESAGQVFAIVNGRQEPLIRFEGHYFHQRLTDPQRSQAVSMGLAHPKAGGVKNPASQQARWDKLFKPATKINPHAAFESTSWGLGQVMGSHWSWLGYASPAEMLRTARAGAAGQIELMIRYIEKAGLVDELQRRDFAAFTRGYNGPGGIKAGYHTKMARAYERRAGTAPVSKADGMLRMGSKGARVRELQALLVRAGHPVKVDGDFGPSTKAALIAFQQAAGLAADGVAGPETMRALSAYRVAPDEQPGHQPVTEVDEVKDAAKGLGPIAIVMAVRDQIAEAASWLLGIEAGTAQMLASWLMAGVSVIGVGLAIYGAYGWWKSRRTVEVPA